MKVSMDDLNHAEQQQFGEQLGGIFEHSRWVADMVYSERPFASRQQLYQAMVEAVRRASAETRMELLRSHPQLAGKEASAGTLTNASQREQAGAGLDQCSADELATIDALNLAYLSKFGFPFIIAVSGLDKFQIMAAMKKRCDHSPEQEFDTANAEVEKIALIRINALIND